MDALTTELIVLGVDDQINFLGEHVLCLLYLQDLLSGDFAQTVYELDLRQGHVFGFHCQIVNILHELQSKVHRSQPLALESIIFAVRLLVLLVAIWTIFVAVDPPNRHHSLLVRLLPVAPSCLSAEVMPNPLLHIERILRTFSYFLHVLEFRFAAKNFGIVYTIDVSVHLFPGSR